MRKKEKERDIDRKRKKDRKKERDRQKEKKRESKKDTKILFSKKKKKHKIDSCISESFNTNISHQLFDNTITFVNSHNYNINSRGDFVQK